MQRVGNCCCCLYYDNMQYGQPATFWRERTSSFAPVVQSIGTGWRFDSTEKCLRPTPSNGTSYLLCNKHLFSRTRLYSYRTSFRMSGSLNYHHPGGTLAFSNGSLRCMLPQMTADFLFRGYESVSLYANAIPTPTGVFDVDVEHYGYTAYNENKFHQHSVTGAISVFINGEYVVGVPTTGSATFLPVTHGFTASGGDARIYAYRMTAMGPYPRLALTVSPSSHARLHRVCPSEPSPSWFCRKEYRTVTITDNLNDITYTVYRRSSASAPVATAFGYSLSVWNGCNFAEHESNFTPGAHLILGSVSTTYATQGGVMLFYPTSNPDGTLAAANYGYMWSPLYSFNRVPGSPVLNSYTWIDPDTINIAFNDPLRQPHDFTLHASE